MSANQHTATAIGYVVVDRETKALDWDGELHPSIEAGIASLTGPFHMYCATQEEVSDEKTYWADHYMICPVMPESA